MVHFGRFDIRYEQKFICVRALCILSIFNSFRFSLLIFVCSYLPFILFAHHHFILFYFGCCCSLLKSLFALVLLVFMCVGF